MAQMSQPVEILGSSPPRNNISPTFPDNGTTTSRVDQVQKTFFAPTQALSTSPPAVLDSLVRNPHSTRLGSPPPIIRSSVLSPSTLSSPPSENHHSMVVDCILSTWVRISLTGVRQEMKVILGTLMMTCQTMTSWMTL